MTTLARPILVVAALVFLAVGIGFLVAPVELSAVVSIDLLTAEARTDLRATYGGFNTGIGLFLLVAARRDAWLRPGIAVVGFAGLGYGGGRLIGILADGEISPMMLIFLLIEISITAIAAVVYRRLPGTAA